MLRPYQETSIADTRKHLYEEGKKSVLIWLATGAGKTVIFCRVLKSLFDNKASAVMVVKGRQLVEQASQRLFREGVPHGVFMAGHWNYRPYEKIQVCSVDTMISREWFPPAEVLVVDEAHMATTDGYNSVFDKYTVKPEGAAEEWEPTKIISVTATPYTKKTLHRIAEAVVHPITMQELTDQGYLVPARYFCPSTIDLRGVTMSGDDYNQTQLGKAADKSELIGDIIAHWRGLAEDRPTVCFAVNVRHSQHIAQRFNEAGIAAEHCDADTPDSQRQDCIRRLGEGKLKIFCNVNIFSTGVDIPFLSCIVMARPTKSYILYIQQAGRGTRTFKGKKDFILLDHAGNVLQHGFITDEQEANTLPTGPQSKKKFAPSAAIHVCPKCFAAFIGNACPACGHVMTTAEIGAEQDGSLKEITNLPPEELYLAKLKQTAKNKGYKRGWVYFRFIDRFGEEKARQYFKPRNVPDFVRARKLEDEADEFLRQYAEAKAK